MGVRFSRTPYTVTYTKDGVKHTIKRQPPAKLHEMMPEDKVSLSRTKNADFESGDVLTVKNISQRQPNVLQLVNEEGLSTFVDYYDAKLEQVRGQRESGASPLDLPINNNYLLWP